MTLRNLQATQQRQTKTQKAKPPGQRKPLENRRPAKAVGATISATDAANLTLEFIDEAVAKNLPDPEPKEIESGRKILKLSRADQLLVFRECLTRSIPVAVATGHERIEMLEMFLAGQALPLTESDLDLMAAEIRKRCDHELFLMPKYLLDAIRKSLPENGPSKTAKADLRHVRENYDKTWHINDAGKTAKQIDEMVGDVHTRNPMKPGETWSNAVNRHLQSLPARESVRWIKIFAHCVDASGAKPVKAWKTKATQLLEDIDAGEFQLRMGQWLPLIKQTYEDGDRRDYTELLYDGNVNILKGLVWCCAMRPSKAMVRTLSKTAVYAYRKIPGIGPKSGSLGNACFYSLAQMAEQGGVLELSVLKTKVKQISARKQIQKHLDKAAAAMGITPDQIEELSVPNYGLTGPGVLEEPLGDFTCRLSLATPSVIDWKNNETGKVQKSAPAAVKADASHALRIKEIKQIKKDVARMLPVQRQRIENLYLQEKSWPFDFWNQHYLKHPLVSVLARRLIWRCELKNGNTVDLIFPDSQPLDVDEQRFNPDDIQNIRPWHPCETETGSIMAWRDVLAKLQIKQPFKQAHREIYLLTPAEEATRIYSNRFAAHIIKQTSFRALAQTRGWTAELLGAWDGGDTGVARKQLPHHGLQVEFWFSAAEDGGFTDGVGWTFLSTDQIRFCDLDSDPIAINEVPKLVLSECLRDVDLFVGVCSVGNDENWMDGGEQPFANYWNQFAFGDLSATAQTRREVLEKLIPRLAISDRCQLDDKFLIVTGSFRTYKIHLGSSNIMMEPGNQYLCIVAKPRQSTEKLFLPFEGDRTLSVILSKALLLADDAEITDQSILAQIKS